MSNITREELLRGVVKVNNERIDSEDLEASSQDTVQGDDSEQGDQSARERGAHAPPAAGPVSGSKESLHEFVERRAGEVVEGIEEVSDQIARVEAELKGLKAERARLVAERKQLEKLSADTSSV